MKTKNIDLKELGDLNVSLGVNLDDLKKRFEEEKQEAEKNQNQSDNRFVILPEGKTVVRILPPYRKDKVEFFKHFLNHRINGRNIICLREQKYTPVSTCPICSLVKALYSQNTEPDTQFANSIRARDKYYFNVVVRSYEPKNKEDIEKLKLTANPTEVKILTTGIKLYEKIKQLVFETEFGDITNVVNGHDFVIVKNTIKTADGLSLPNYDNSYAKPDATPLADDTATIKQILTSMYDLDVLVASMTMRYDDIVAWMEAYLDEIGNTEVLNLFKNSIGRKTSRVSVERDNIASEVKPKEETATVKISDIEDLAEDLEDENENNVDLDDFEKELMSDFKAEE